MSVVSPSLILLIQFSTAGLLGFKDFTRPVRGILTLSLRVFIITLEEVGTDPLLDVEQKLFEHVVIGCLAVGHVYYDIKTRCVLYIQNHKHCA
jgi:hypothetical protein